MSGQLLEPFLKSLVALVGNNMTWRSNRSIDIFTIPVSLSRYMFIPKWCYGWYCKAIHHAYPTIYTKSRRCLLDYRSFLIFPFIQKQFMPVALVSLFLNGIEVVSIDLLNRFLKWLSKVNWLRWGTRCRISSTIPQITENTF